MTGRLVLALWKRGGVPLLAVVGLGWWTLYTDKANRAERAAAEVAYRQERAATETTWREERTETHRAFTAALEKVAENCLLRGRSR